MHLLKDVSVTPPPTSSFIWRGICWSMELFSRGLGKVVRNGHDILFWLDRWLDYTALIDVAIQPIPSLLVYRTVASYWGDRAGWKWQELQQYLSHSSLLKLAAISVCSRQDASDLIAWIPVPHKTYIVKAGHGVAAGWDQMQDCRLWKLLWKLRVQQRSKFFMWELAHGRLLTNEARWRRQLAFSRECAHCVGETETILHAIRDCTLAS